MATLRATGCNVGTQSITIVFSEKVDQNTPPNLGGTDDASALNPANYNLFAPDAGFVNTAFTGSVKAVPDGRSVVLEFGSAVFGAGQWVQVTVTKVAATDPTISPIVSNHVSGRTPSDSARTVKDVEDAISYPVLTEEVAYRPSPVGVSTSGAGGIVGPGGSSLGQVALQAVTDVLGWKANAADPKGFIGALTQAFTLTDVEGHVESKWVPRTYAVQADLGGGITGAQASLYLRAKDALDQSLSLLEGLYPLDPEADPEYVKALREMARSQMNEIVKEFGVVGLPSILRIDTYFKILLGQDISSDTPPPIVFDPDKIGGTLGELRDEYAIYFRGNPFNNSIEDEQDITNFRVISDYMTSLVQSWIANRPFFRVVPRDPAFFGTQLVLISRQFNVISETVNEVRFALDSVFIGPNERQALLLKFRDHSLPPMFLEDVLEEVESFATTEGPRLLRDGGKISVTNNILPVVEYLERLIKGAHEPEDPKSVPDGFRTARVRHALDDLLAQLGDLAKLTKQVEQTLPASEDKLAINKVLGPHDVSGGAGSFMLTVLGNAFDRNIKAEAHSPVGTPALAVDFVSRERIDVTFPYSLAAGSHDLTLRNPDGDSAILEQAFDWDPQKLTVVIGTKSLPPGIVGRDYNPNSQTQLTASGGVPLYTWSITAGSLPSGLTLDSNGTITGTPNQGAVGSSPFTVMVTDSKGSTASQQLSISVRAVLAIITTSLPAATVKSPSPYSQKLEATGGETPYQWSVTSGSLPSGLSLNSEVISGTPTTSGTSPFTVTVTDQYGTQVNQALSIQVNSACDIQGQSPARVSRATVGAYYSLTLQVTGGTPPHKWALPAGSVLPDGLSLSSDGTISGTPTADGTYTFTVQVIDSNGSIATQSLSIAARDDWRERVDHLDKMVDELEKTTKDINEKLSQLLNQVSKNRKVA
jgi:hypothetical protein